MHLSRCSLTLVNVPAAPNPGAPSSEGSATSQSPSVDLARASFSVSAEGDQSGPSGSPSAGMDLALLQQIAAIADGRAPLPGEPAPAVPANQYQAPAAAPAVEPQAPAAPSLEQQFAVLQARHTALEQILLQQQMVQAQAAQQQPTQQDYAAMRAQELQAAGMNPQSREHQAMFDLWHRTQEQDRAIQEMRQNYAALQAQAQRYTIESQMAPVVETAFRGLGVQSVPAEVRAAVMQQALAVAHQAGSIEAAVAHVMQPYRAFAQSMRPAPAPAPVVQQPAGAPNPLAAISLDGRGAGRAPRPTTLEEVTRLVSRG